MTEKDIKEQPKDSGKKSKFPGGISYIPLKEVGHEQ